MHAGLHCSLTIVSLQVFWDWPSLQSVSNLFRVQGLRCFQAFSGFRFHGSSGLKPKPGKNTLNMLGQSLVGSRNRFRVEGCSYIISGPHVGVL